MSYMRAGEGDPRYPAKGGESHLDYIDMLARKLGYVDAAQKRHVLEMPDQRLPYVEREPGEDRYDERSADGPWSDR